MKTRTIYLIVFTILSFVSYSSGKDLTDERSKTYKVSAGDQLYIDANPGDITIAVWNRDEVEIATSGIDENDYENLTIRQSGDKLTVSFNPRWSHSTDLSLKITVPNDLIIKVNTTAGEIKIKDNIEGKINLFTSGGDVSVKDVKGDLQIQSSGGDITTDNIVGIVSVRTQGGDITLGNIKSTSASVSTMGGDIKIKSGGSLLNVETLGGDILVERANGDLNARSSGGDVVVGEFGGNSLRIETLGGDLKFGPSNGNVLALTSGGDIYGGKITGSADVKTNGGDINLELDPKGENSNRVLTNGGVISVILPSDAAVTVEAKIKLRGNARDDSGEYKITTDFPSAVIEENNTRLEKSSVIKINGGGKKIYLESSNGSIRIQKK
ncbi:MAG: hypothetical protein J5I57_13850 [Melioribacteraceae bacterium]|nr:hypothetical protein [Melioribacteraceae bacterium]